ncbi:hypothetical protein [Marinomonas sp. FW-1]|uniref:hypothetical protein n=1 Tax=Marinomonas sp. FW-1 TaxID=2071621 RepID=UPI0010BF751E|nr:hypothetical protein [Marinomonas sp. FW-1]
MVNWLNDRERRKTMTQPELSTNNLMNDVMTQCEKFYYQMGPFSALTEFEKASVERDIRVKISHLSELSKGYSHVAMMYLQVALGNQKEVSKAFFETLNYLDNSTIYSNYASHLNCLGFPKMAVQVLEDYLASTPAAMSVIVLLSNLYKGMGAFSKDAKLMETYLKSHRPQETALQEYLVSHGISPEETEQYFTLVSNYFLAQRIEHYKISRRIVKDHDDKDWLCTEFQIEDELSSDQIHSINLGLSSLLAGSNLSKKASEHFITQIY